jgi:hypothetical protein
MKSIHQMFRRFRNDITNHEIILYSRPIREKGIIRWYYYNLIDDKKGWEEVSLRKESKINLGLQKRDEWNRDVMEMSDKERRRRIQDALDEMTAENDRRLKRKKNKVSKRKYPNMLCGHRMFTLLYRVR